jgi:hypothetical protein
MWFGLFPHGAWMLGDIGNKLQMYVENFAALASAWSAVQSHCSADFQVAGSCCAGSWPQMQPNVLRQQLTACYSI